jgi:hypothetical protein
MMGSHLLLFELSLPIVSPQVQPSTALPAEVRVQHGLGVSGANLAAALNGQRRRKKVDYARESPSPPLGVPVISQPTWPPATRV